MKMHQQPEKEQNAGKLDRQRRLNRGIGVCLAYLLVVLFVLIPTTLSSYVSTTSGEDSVRVARMSLDSEIVFSVKQIHPGETVTLDFVLSGEASEVTQEYSLLMSCTQNLPLSYSLSCEPTEGRPVQGSIQPGQTYSGELKHGEEHVYSLVIYWDASKTAYQYANEFDYITITTQSVQVD